MVPTTAELGGILRTAAEVELMPRFRRVGFHHKADGSLITEADTAAQERIRRALAERWPDIPFLGEEMAAEERQALLDAADRPLWVLDPVDGTSNFAGGVPYFCVALALLVNRRPELALVYDPNQDELFSATRGQGAQLNGTPLDAAAAYSGGLIALIDFKRLPPELSRRLVGEAPFTSQRNFGSSALDWCQIAAGRAAFYLHGRQQLWDYAGGCLILAEAGGYAATLGGEPILGPELGPRSVVAAPTRERFEEWCHWLGIKPLE